MDSWNICTHIFQGWSVDINERHGVSNLLQVDCLLSRLFRLSTKQISNLALLTLCAWNPPVTSGYPAQRTSNAEIISISWRRQKEGNNCQCWILFYMITISTSMVETNTKRMEIDHLCLHFTYHGVYKVYILTSNHDLVINSFIHVNKQHWGQLINDRVYRRDRGYYQIPFTYCLIFPTIMCWVNALNALLK